MTWHARLHGSEPGIPANVWFTLATLLDRHFMPVPFAKPGNDNRPHPTEWR